VSESTDIPKGYKATELGELPEGWDIKPLSEVISFRKGRKPNNLSETPANDAVPYLTADYFRTGIPSQYVDISKDPSAITVAIDDVVFIWDGSNAGDVFPGLKGVLASTMTVIRADQNKVLNDWIYYVLKTNFSTFNNQTTGSTIPHVNKNIFLNLPVPLPPLPEQHAIATTLSTVQEAKEKTDAVIAATKALKTAMMTHLFTNDSLSNLDYQDWKECILGDVINLKRGYDLPDRERVFGNFPVISSSGIFRYHNEPKVKGPGVVTGRYGTLGKVFYVETDFWPLNTTLYVQDFKGNNPRYVSYLLQTIGLAEQNFASSVPGVNRNILHQLTVKIPSITIQVKIATILSSIDQKLAAEQFCKEALDTLFSSLLHNLMTAKIRVKNIV
jgi:type I restriction enzyme S subunit